MIKVVFTTEFADHEKTYVDQWEMKADLKHDFIAVNKKENKFCLIPRNKIVMIHVWTEEGETNG